LQSRTLPEEALPPWLYARPPLQQPPVTEAEARGTRLGAVRA